MNSEFTPLRSYCIVDIPETGIETSSGISLSQAQAYSTPVTGKVLKAGAKSRFTPGDQLFFRRYSVDELRLVTEDDGDKQVFLIEDADVVGVRWSNRGIINRLMCRLLAKFQ